MGEGGGEVKEKGGRGREEIWVWEGVRKEVWGRRGGEHESWSWSQSPGFGSLLPAGVARKTTTVWI